MQLAVQQLSLVEHREQQALTFNSSIITPLQPPVHPDEAVFKRLLRTPLQSADPIPVDPVHDSALPSYLTQGAPLPFGVAYHLSQACRSTPVSRGEFGFIHLYDTLITTPLLDYLKTQTAEILPQMQSYRRHNSHQPRWTTRSLTGPERKPSFYG
eukprot:gnl/Trimastix_PCT/3179.p4 GENE.gnl/Trimastix_PCT/3179~~gnl/Trimastix_PCT/3179.p4  ORF type:complete len:155 (+),score=10.25 gnl/Trimastix_PCT/3179:686-1150(+)